MENITNHLRNLGLCAFSSLQAQTDTASFRARDLLNLPTVSVTVVYPGQIERNERGAPILRSFLFSLSLLTPKQRRPKKAPFRELLDFLHMLLLGYWYYSFSYMNAWLPWRSLVRFAARSRGVVGAKSFFWSAELLRTPGSAVLHF